MHFRVADRSGQLPIPCKRIKHGCGLEPVLLSFPLPQRTRSVPCGLGGVATQSRPQPPTKRLVVGGIPAKVRQSCLAFSRRAAATRQKPPPDRSLNVTWIREQYSCQVGDGPVGLLHSCKARREEGKKDTAHSPHPPHSRTRYLPNMLTKQQLRPTPSRDSSSPRSAGKSPLLASTLTPDCFPHNVTQRHALTH